MFRPRPSSFRKPSPLSSPPPSDGIPAAERRGAGQSRVAGLAVPASLTGLTLRQVHVVMAMRLAVVCHQAGRDPLPEMAARLRSMPAARALLDLHALIGDAWPEAFMVSRPCCALISHDEVTLAALVAAAADCDANCFAAHIADLVAAPRHGPLFRQTALVVAALQPLLPTVANRQQS